MADDDGQHEARTLAQGATDDEELARVRRVVRDMRRGRAHMSDTREAVSNMEFLLRYIFRQDDRWRVAFEDEVTLRIKRREEATRKRKMDTQRRRRDAART